MSYSTKKAIEWYSGVPRSTRVPAICGYALLSLAVLGFGAWGNTAPIAGAVIANGVFVATGQNKVVQHLEGGVIREILVREGDIVVPGQTLINLDDTAAKTEMRRLLLRETRLLTTDARLQAEMREEEAIVFPADVKARIHDPDVRTNIESQELTFIARRNSLKSEIATLKEAIGAFQERMDGTKIQRGGVHSQLGLLEEELEGKSFLLKGGLIRKPEVLAVQRARANLQGEVGRLTGEIGNAREQIARAKEQMVSSRNNAIKAAAEQLHEVRGELADVRERIAAAKDILNRITIAAPVKGIVVKMRYHTAGGVIEAGKPVMEIVPVQEELIIEVRVRPQDIESVKRGSKAVVRLNTLNRRVTPMLDGEVVYVSADALPNERAAQQQAPNDLFVARVQLDPVHVAELGGFQPQPGMPAEVYITTADRTFFEYLMQPIKDSMSRAFRES
jgi:HlyD family type I secretion membrane fusion protein